MFTGIIETLGKVINIEKEDNNIHFWIESPFTRELKVDQSVAHNGVCLTVVEISDNKYRVTAINETLVKTNLNDLKINDYVNLERGMKLGDRLDGHIVQGHVDQTGLCKSIEEVKGSWIYSFEYEKSENLTIEKGSITINGVSLTVFNSGENTFSVGIIPYTYKNTTFKNLKEKQKVNLEFDVIGKYVSKFKKQI